jgi:flagellar hook-length control protein FliK
MIKPVTSTPPSPAQSGDSSAAEATPGAAFGTVLARQVQEKSTASSKSAQSTNAAEIQANAAAPAQIGSDAAIAPDAASITIAALNKKDIKLPVATAKEASAKTHRDPVVTTPDAANIIPMVAPEIRANGGASSPGVNPATAGKSSTNPGMAYATPGISVQAAAGVNPKLTDGASPKIVDGASPKVAAEITNAQGYASRITDGNSLKPDASASDPKNAPATPDFARLMQAATGNSAPEVVTKPVLETKQAAVQQAQLATVQAAINSPVLTADATTHRIESPLGSNAWTGEFSQKISWLSHEQSQVAELHLNPPDLGPMHVVISVSDNQATAQFSSPHSEVRHAIENALPKLRESLADNGIMLGNATVSDQTPRDSGAGQFAQQSRNRASVINTAEPAAISAPIAPTRRHTGMLDTFA